jgi:hypothetical protein
MSDLNVYTTAEINALTPITGDLVLDSTLNAVKLYDGAAWKTFNSSIAYENRWGASFDGSSDYLDCGNDSSLSPANLTVSAWCKVSGSVAAYNYLLSKYGAQYGSMYLRYTSANKFNFFLGFNGGYKDGTFNTAVTLTDWHHVALTYDGSYIKGYVDGVEDYSVAETRAIHYAPDSSGRDQFEIGRGAHADEAEGLIDEAAIFDTALSGADITAIYNSGVPNDLTLAGSYDTDRTANLKGYWRMGDDSSDTATSGGSIATITDSSGNGNDATQGTASNQPTFSDLTGESIYL